MKRVLIITSKGSKIVSWHEREKYIKEFTESIDKSLDGYEVSFTTYSDIHCIVDAEEVKVIDSRNQASLSDFDFVQFKNWHGNLEFASVLARYLSEKKIKFANKEVECDINIGKLAQAFVFRTQGVPTPKTLYMMTDGLKKVSQEELQNLGFNFPLILKQVDGSRGDNNHLCAKPEDIHSVIEKDLEEAREAEYIIQNFIPNDGDLRILFIGADNSPLVFRRQAAGGSHLNNTSKGGQGQLLDNSQLPAIYIEDAKKAARALRCEIAGVDIITDKNTDQHYVLEVNSTPAIATGFMVEEKVKRFINYIQQETK